MNTICIVKNIYYGQHSQQNVNFTAKLSVARKKTVASEVTKFRAQINIPREDSLRRKNAIGRIIHPVGFLLGFASCTYALLTKHYMLALASIAAGTTNLPHGLLFHSIAVRKAKILARRMGRKGFSLNEREHAVKNMLWTEGGLLFSKVFSLVCPNSIRNIANGK